MKILILIVSLGASFLGAQTYNTSWAGSGSSSTDSSTLDGQTLQVEWLGGTGFWEANRSLNLASSGFTVLTGTANSFTESAAASFGNNTNTYEFSLASGYAFGSDLHIIVSSTNGSGSPMMSFVDFTTITIAEQRQGGFDGGPVNAATTAFSAAGNDLDLNLSGLSEATAILRTTDAAGLNSFRVIVDGDDTLEETGIALYGSVAPVPEPSTGLLLGVLGAGLALRRRNR